MINQKLKELKVLKEKRDAILKACQHWKSCKDGSYGLALHNAGLNTITEKINNLELSLEEQ